MCHICMRNVDFYLYCERDETWHQIKFARLKKKKNLVLSPHANMNIYTFNIYVRNITNTSGLDNDARVRYVKQ